MKREPIPSCAQAGASEADGKTCFRVHVLIKTHAFHETCSGEKVVFLVAKRFRNIGDVTRGELFLQHVLASCSRLCADLNQENVKFFSLFVHYISSLQKLAYICYNIYHYIMAGDLSKLC